MIRSDPPCTIGLLAFEQEGMMERYRDYLNPEELAMLQSVLDQFCSKRGFAQGSVERENAAEALLGIFRQGAADEDALREKLNAVTVS